jgi:hypothetical protein
MGRFKAVTRSLVVVPATCPAVRATHEHVMEMTLARNPAARAKAGAAEATRRRVQRGRAMADLEMA